MEILSANAAPLPPPRRHFPFATPQRASPEIFADLLSDQFGGEVRDRFTVHYSPTQEGQG